MSFFGSMDCPSVFLSFSSFESGFFFAKLHLIQSLHDILKVLANHLPIGSDCLKIRIEA